MEEKSQKLRSERTLNCIRSCDEILTVIDTGKSQLLAELSDRYRQRLGDQPDAFGAVLSALRGEIVDGRAQLVEVRERHQSAAETERAERQKRDEAISALRSTLTPVRSLCDRMFGHAFSDQVGFARKVPYTVSGLLRKTGHVLKRLASPDLVPPEPLFKAIPVTPAGMAETLAPPYERLRLAATAVAKEQEEAEDSRQTCVAATGETEEILQRILDVVDAFFGLVGLEVPQVAADVEPSAETDPLER
jgi:hypothetical protein